ncbi:hypothetical protein, partial [Micromonospora sp. RV43]|uniref:hypothetical protein n=1 Tax=Micromonospora sp. RV43 TaxID=1661387 RepID=UPI000AFD4EA7
ARVAVLADIMRRSAPERSATETEQQLWADADALHTWTPIYDDLTARARIPEHLAIVRQLSGPALADRLAHDLALPALINRLTTYAAAGHEPRDILRRVIRVRELDTADDIAAVLIWRIDRLMQRATADPAVAERPEHWRTHTDRLPADLTGDIGGALRQVAAICGRRAEALAHLAAQTRPAWSLALGDIPTDDFGRQQWLTRAEVVAAYRDTYQLIGDHPIGPEPRTSDITRWNAWHRARLVLGAAALAGKLTTAPDAELTRLITAQRDIDGTAPAYVADELRATYRALTDTEHHRHDLTQLLAAADAPHRHTVLRAQRLQPRWWHRGPSRTRRLTAQRDLHTHTAAAADQVSSLQQKLASLDHQIAEHSQRATALDAQHAAWKRWYDSALPARYAGLAAAAEQARRAASRNAALANVVAATTARVQAVADTRPTPHTTPVREHLPQHAHDAYERITTRHNTNETEID